MLPLLIPVLGFQNIQSFETAAFTLPGGPVLLARQTVPLRIHKELPNGVCGRIWVLFVFVVAVFFYSCDLVAERVFLHLALKILLFSESLAITFYSPLGLEQMCYFLPN